MTVARQIHDGELVTVADRLAECEAVIERSYIERGLALKAIRDERLYRETHSTFEAYCADRWDMSRTSAYRAIDTASLAEAMSPIGDIPANEGQARELTGLTPEAAADVMTATAERTNGKVTAAAIRETRAELETSQDPDEDVDASDAWWAETRRQAAELGLGQPEPTSPATPARPEPAPTPRRKPLPDSFWTTRYDLVKKVESLHRLSNDDRFPQNRQKVAEANLNDLLRCRDLLQQVIDELSASR